MDEDVVRRIEVAIDWAEEGTTGQVLVQLDHEPIEDTDARAAAVWDALDVDDVPAVLVFVSMVRREVRVLASPAVRAGVEPEFWTRMVGLVHGGFRRGQAAEGFEAALQQIGALLRRLAPG